MRRLFEVNSEPHTGARPSVRLCVGPELSRCVHKRHYVGTTFTLKMNSNDKILSDNIVNKQHINVLKLPHKMIDVGLHLQL